MEELTERLIKFFGEEWLLYALDPTILAIIIKICCILAISIPLCCIAICYISRWIIQAPWQRHKNSPTRRSTESLNQRGESQSINVTTTDIVAIDCEMVHCHTTKEWLETARKPHKKRAAVAAHYAIVNYNLEVVCEGYIKPPLDVEDWKGLKDFQTQVEGGENFYEAKKEILRKLRGKRVVAHQYQHDLYSLKIYDFPKNDIRDTSTCKLLRENADLTHLNSTHPHIKLKVLAKRIFGEHIHFQPNRRVHNPVEDAKMAMSLYKKVEEEWEEVYRRAN